MAQQQSSRLNLESFLIMPVQRIPRYLLLMRDMLKYTHKHHPDYSLLQQALSKLGTLLQEHNKGIDSQASDLAHKMLAVGNSIANIEDVKADSGGTGLIHAKRKFIYEGEVTVKEKAGQGQKSKTLHVPSARLKQLDVRGSLKPYLFLFHDMLVFCEQNVSRKDQSLDRPFIYGSLLQLVRVKEVQFTEKEPRTIRLALVGGGFWVLKTKTPQEATSWIAALRQAVAQVNG